MFWMKISIAMATYNGEKYLQEQLDSFVNQTRLPDELVVSDDCSRDRTIQIIQEFSKTAPFEVILNRNSETLGYAGNFNKALELTSGDLVFLSDQDDVWFPNKLKRIEEETYLSDAMLIMNDAALTDENLNDLRLTKMGQIRSGDFKESFFVMGCCAAIKREFLDLALPIPNGYPAHDSWLVGLAQRVGKKAIIDETLQFYRRYGTNESKFIANRTSRISRYDVFKDRLFRLLFKKRSKSGSQIDNYKIFHKRVEDRLQHEKGCFRSQLSIWAMNMRTYISILEKRELILKKNRILRVPEVFKYWKEGNYIQFSGWRTAARDILSR